MAPIGDDYGHLVKVPMWHYDTYFSGASGISRICDDPYVHPESYGYVHGEDPFNPKGETNSIEIIVLLLVAAYLFFEHNSMKADMVKLGEIFYHQRLTAFMIEDEIRRLRLEAQKAA